MAFERRDHVEVWLWVPKGHSPARSPSLLMLHTWMLDLSSCSVSFPFNKKTLRCTLIAASLGLFNLHSPQLMCSASDVVTVFLFMYSLYFVCIHFLLPSLHNQGHWFFLLLNRPSSAFLPRMYIFKSRFFMSEKVKYLIFLPLLSLLPPYLSRDPFPPP